MGKKSYPVVDTGLLIVQVSYLRQFNYGKSASFTAF